jgi:hypothetical protein
MLKTNFYTHNDDVRIDVNGTSFQDTLWANYTDIVDTFGMPMEGDNYKTDAEWEILFENGTVATIYNWKDGKNYCGEEDGLDVEDIREWHIGGHDGMCRELVKHAMKEVTEC